MIPHYFDALTIVLLISMVLGRVGMLNRRGIAAMKFGRTDKSDFAIPPGTRFWPRRRPPVRKSRFTEAQIVGILKQSDAGTPTNELCRQHGISHATFYKWKSKFGGMEVSDVAKMRALED